MAESKRSGNFSFELIAVLLGVLLLFVVGVNYVHRLQPKLEPVAESIAEDAASSWMAPSHTMRLRNDNAKPIELWWDEQWSGDESNWRKWSDESIQPGASTTQEGELHGQWILKDTEGHFIASFPHPEGQVIERAVVHKNSQLISNDTPMPRPKK